VERSGNAGCERLTPTALDGDRVAGSDNPWLANDGANAASPVQCLHELGVIHSHGAARLVLSRDLEDYRASEEQITWLQVAQVAEPLDRQVLAEKTRFQLDSQFVVHVVQHFLRHDRQLARIRLRLTPLLVPVERPSVIVTDHAIRSDFDN
jgi:hypothetical protein